MKRREFLKSTAAAGLATLGAPYIANAQALEAVNVGHLVGICMSPLFYAKATEIFKEEGLDVQMKFMPNPGDALTALNSGAMDIIHNPFTNAFVAAGHPPGRADRLRPFRRSRSGEGRWLRCPLRETDRDR